jgi:hypothetical protein
VQCVPGILLRKADAAGRLREACSIRKKRLRSLRHREKSLRSLWHREKRLRSLRHREKSLRSLRYREKNLRNMQYREKRLRGRQDKMEPEEPAGIENDEAGAGQNR